MQQTNQLNGISARALAIARAIDRLPFGFNYVIDLNKPDMESESWRVNISRLETLRRMTVSKSYMPE